MSYHEHQIVKIYWQISEVAEMLNVETSCIRYWLDYFNIPVKRNRAGNRYFTREDIAKVSQIHHLLKEDLYTLEGAKKKLQHG